ncbi:carboxypeptidase-like regulatory domain-containing protein [Arachidicoccus ginsenosidivorans]|uniref:carboxypeptidase-like regulatory domain-containing protein n=1 Tax=Arachidicoccus ginsenosidivorans TaxID=496057 RepID=UPI0013150418|nr:carboxypeptidase-like regulatory domain-containing protein [Arachidicoccus ginsenosidivorans]
MSLLILSVTGLKAQQNSHQTQEVMIGILKDSNKTAIYGATLKLMKASDTAKVKYQISDSLGHFSFTGITPDTYILDIQSQNFVRLQKYLSIDNEQDTLNIGTLLLADHYNDMDVVSVTAVRPVTMNGDTTEFNADAYKVKPDATAGDLLNKMSGIEVDKDGNVQSDGQAVPKVYVNGKPFFGDNPAMAIKNLPADAIKKFRFMTRRPIRVNSRVLMMEKGFALSILLPDVNLRAYSASLP